MDGHLSIEAMRHLFSYGATHAEVNESLAHIVPCPMCWDLASEVIALLKETNDLVPTKRGRPPECRFRDARDAFLVLVEIRERHSIDYLRAQGWGAELQDLSPREQMEKIRSVAAVQKREVLADMVREAMVICRRDPFAGEHLAMSAYSLVDHIPAGDFSAKTRAGLRLSAMTAVANSRRLAGNWEGAQSAIQSARYFLGRAPTEDEARLLAIQAALCSDTGLFEEAFALLSQASRLYRHVDNAEGLSIVAVQEADSLLIIGVPHEALKKAKYALTFTMPDRLKMLAKSIVTESLIVLGRPSAAMRNYEATRSLYENLGDELTLLKEKFLASLLLDALGHARESEKLLRKAIHGATELELYRLSSLWRVALVESLVKRDALAKASRVCEEAIELLQETEGIHAQMLQVWRGLLAAIQAKLLKTCHIAEMRQYLARHWTSPAAHLPVFVSLSQSIGG
jgi:tetratricopeptide (TPR) repeat protein